MKSNCVVGWSIDRQANVLRFCRTAYTRSWNQSRGYASVIRKPRARTQARGFKITAQKTRAHNCRTCRTITHEFDQKGDISITG